MATPQNDSSVRLYATEPRNIDPTSGKMLFLNADSRQFKVDGAVITPSSIVFTARMLGFTGTVSWSITAGNTLTGSTPNTRTLTFANMVDSSVTVSCSIVYLGQTYNSEQIIITKNEVGGDLTVGGSLFPSLDESYWVTESSTCPIVTVTDGPSGTTARRSAAGADLVFRSNTTFVIDRTRTYRVRFWARASATANGSLYHTLRQFLANGNPGPTNGGRSPYKPAAAAPGTAQNWTEYSYLWTPADWQAGVTQVRPDFLMNYTGTAGYWEVQDYKMLDVTDAVNAQASADAALTALTNIASDSILSPSEKPQVVLDYGVIVDEQAAIALNGTKLALTTETSAFTNAYSALTSYLGTLTGWNTIPGGNVTIVGTTFRQMFEDYYVTRQALLNAIGNRTLTASTDLTLIGSSNIQLVGNTAAKTGGTTWNEQVYSGEGYVGGAFASVKLAVGGVIFGLNPDPTTDANHTSIDHALYAEVTGNNLYIWRNGTSQGLVGTWAVGDVLTVVYDGSNVYYQKNGVNLGTVAASAGIRYYFDSSFATTGKVSNIRFGPMTSNNWTSIGGGGKPEDNATVGANATNLLIQMGGDNLFPNSGFELQDGTNRPYGYIAYNSNPVAITYPVVAGRLSGKAYALRSSQTVVAGGSNTFGLRNSSAVEAGFTPGVRGGWQPNKKYVLSFKAKKVNGATFTTPSLRWNVAPASVTSVTNPTLSTAWQNFTFRITWGASVETLGNFFIDVCNFAAITTGDEIHIDELIVQEGDFGTEWFASTEDANIAAAAASAAATTAQSGADSANATLANIASDSKLVPSEKHSVRLEWDARVSEKANINATAATYAGVASLNTAYNSAFQALGNYLNNGTAYTVSTTVPPSWINDASLGTTTDIVGATWRANWKAMYDARQTLLNAIAVEAGKFALWVNTTGAGRPSDNATADLALVSSGTAVLVGNKATKTTGATAWDSEVRSLNSYTGGAYASARADNAISEMMFGLNTDPATNASYTSIDYAFYMTLAGGLEVYEGGAARGSFGTYTTNDILVVAYDGNCVNYTKNGVILRTVAASIVAPLFFDSSLANLSCSISNISFGPLTPSSSSLSWVNSAGTVVSGGTLRKISGGTAWNEQVYSAASFTGGAYASARAGLGSCMFGLNTDPAANASFNSIDYAMYFEAGGVCQAYENGTLAAGLGTWAAGDIGTVSYDGVLVRYFKNGTIVRAVSAPYNLKLYFDSSFNEVGSYMTNVVFGPMTSTNWQDTGGDGRPSNYATVGPADAATSMGFNPQFSDWPTGQVTPTGWAAHGPYPAYKESSIIRTGPFSVGWNVGATSSPTGMQRQHVFPDHPFPVGAYIRGSYDAYIQVNNGGTGFPGYYFRLYTNAALTTYQDTAVPVTRKDISGWQRVPFSVTPTAGTRIYGIQIFQLAADSAMPGGVWSAGSIVYFDNLTFEFVQPATENQTIVAPLVVSGLSNVSGSVSNGSNIYISGQDVTITNGTAPYNYSWLCTKEYGPELFITATGPHVDLFASGNDTLVEGYVSVTVTDSRGKAGIGSFSVFISKGIPP